MPTPDFFGQLESQGPNFDKRPECRFGVFSLTFLLTEFSFQKPSLTATGPAGNFQSKNSSEARRKRKKV